MSGLPATFAPGCPSSRTVAPYSPAQTTNTARGPVGDSAASAAFIPDTNAIEALNRQLRKALKTKGSFPSEDAARKLIYLAITKAETKWKRVFNWPAALAAFTIEVGDRIPDN